MTTKKIYIGSFGAHLYDDEAEINDPDGDFSGETLQAIRSDGSATFDGDLNVAGDLSVSGDVSVTGSMEASEVKLIPKASSTGAEGTIFYDSDDDHVYVATE